jgi:hypothetical protein
MADGSQAGHPVVSRTSGQTILVASPHILTGHILTVGLAQSPHGLAGASHQPWRHPHHQLPGGQQVTFPAGQ